MENKTTAFLLFTLFILLTAGPTTALSESTGKLSVNINGFPSSEGFAMVALHHSEQSYEGGEAGAMDKEKVSVLNRQTRVVFENVTYGWYGIALYHDENANGKLDTNAMGIPREAYGFSNNAKGFFGKPKYKDVLFEMNSAEKEITINLE